MIYFVRRLSIVQLVWMALFAVSLPSVWAVFTALYQLDSLIKNNTDAIFTAKKETALSRSIADRLTSMERSANQFRILKDPSLFEVYTSNRKQLRSELSVFLDNAPDSKRFAIGNQLLRQESQLHDALKNNPTQLSEKIVEKNVTALYDLIKKLILRTDALLTQQNNRLAKEAENLKEDLVAQAFLVVPTTLLLGAFFFIVITKPIRQLDMAVHSLGSGDLSGNIKISGPNDLRELGVRLNWLCIRLQEVETQKQAFFRTISHELKTPLTSIREGASLLLAAQEHAVSNEQHAIIDIINASGKELQRLIESLLQFNELACASEEIARISITKIFDDIVAIHRLAIAKKSLRIRKSIENTSINTVPKQISLIIDNLVTNAIRFSPKNEVIELEATITKDHIVIRVKDNGPGVAIKDIPHIFEIFYRGSVQPKEALRGSGLGLSIAKEMTDRLRGSIKLNHTISGASFTVTLPLYEIEEGHYA